MRYLTAGESHGPQLTVIIEGLPSQFPLSIEQINDELTRRQQGYGRGRRMQIERDRVQIVSGMRFGVTTGAPLTMVIENKDFVHWQKVMDPERCPEEEEIRMRRISRPRPGHADLNGALKYSHRDMRDVLERSSARETAARVAVGAIAKQLLQRVGVEIGGHVVALGEVQAVVKEGISLQKLTELAEGSPVRCIDPQATTQMIQQVEETKKAGDTLGGIVEIWVEGVPAGVGSHVHWDRKLDGRLAQAVMSIQAFKGVEIGLGFQTACLKGSAVQDEIGWSAERGYYRMTNRLGGLEGGMTNGERVIVRGVMKPIPTLYRPLQSVDIDSKETVLANLERSDCCAVPAACVVAEHVIAWEMLRTMSEQFAGDTLEEWVERVQKYRERIAHF